MGPLPALPTAPNDLLYVPHVRVLLRGLGIDAVVPSHPKIEVNTRFLAFLIDAFYRLFPFDPVFYRTRYPDIAAAEAKGELSDLLGHFLAHGLAEGRLPFEVPIDAGWYLKQFPDLSKQMLERGITNLLDHYESIGRPQGATPHPLLQDVARRWDAETDVDDRSLVSATLDGALIQPYLLPVVPGFRGGLVLGDGVIDRRLRQRRHHRPADQFPGNDQQIQRLSGEFVYGGPCYAHFGHVMSEMIHRVLPSRARFACRKFVFVDGCSDHKPLGGWKDLAPAMQAALAFLEVAPDDVTVIRDNRVVEKLHVVQQGSEIPTGPSLEYLEMLKSYTCPRLAALPDQGTRGSRLYVSRSKIHEGGLILGESYVEECLAEEGWTVFHPEDWSLVDQMQMYRRAEVLLFAAGSSVHGVELFGANDLGHCVLLPRGHAPASYFEAVLRPRARRYDTLMGATQIGTAAADASGARIEELGVSLLNLPGFIRDIRRLKLGKLRAFKANLWQDRASFDLDQYIRFHVKRDRVAGAPTRAVTKAELSQLRAECLAILGQPARPNKRGS